MKSEEGINKSPYRLSKTPEFSVRNSFQTQGRARTTHVPGPRQLVKHPRLLTTIPGSRTTKENHYGYQIEDIEENLKKRQISIEDRIMELLIASKRQLSPKKRRQNRDPLALQSNKVFDHKIVENTKVKRSFSENDQISIPVQTIKGPKTLEEKKSHPLLTPGSIYRTRIGDRQILKITLPSTL